MGIDESKWVSEFHGMELDPIAEPNKRHNENGVLFFFRVSVPQTFTGRINTRRYS